MDYRKLCLPWSLQVMNIDWDNELEVADVSYKNYRTNTADLLETKSRPLPQRISLIYGVDYPNKWLTVHIDSHSLFLHIQKLTKGDHRVPVRFELYFNSKMHDLKFVVSNGQKTEICFDCEVELDEVGKEQIEAYWKNKKETQAINQLMKEAWQLLKFKKYEQAQEKCNAVIDLNPKYGFAYFLKLRLIWYQKGFQACLARMEYFINKTEHEPPALAHIYNCYGCLYDEEMKYKEALGYFELAVATNPKEGMYLSNLAEIHYKLKDPQKSVHYANKSAAICEPSTIVKEIIKNKGKIDEVNFLETQLGRLAVMYRSESDENARKKTIEHYHETYYKMVKLNRGIIGLDPDAQLPDSLMPQEYVNYWLGKNND